MKKNNHLKYLFFVFVSVLLLSSKELPDKSDLIREKVDEKLAEFQKKEAEKCTKKILEHAGVLVDSMLIARAKLQGKEMMVRPEIPFRPDRPEVKLPKDTMPVVPIFSEKDSVFMSKKPKPVPLKKEEVDSVKVKH